MSNPDQIEHEIDRTRQSLSTHVDQLGDKVSPSKFVGRRVDRMKDSAGSMKDRLMGSGGDGAGALHSAGDSIGSAASSAKGAAASVTEAPQALRKQTTGNPLAAGLVAFGAGWLLSSLIPVSEAEQDAAKRMEDNAGGLVEPLKQSAQEVAGNLQQPLQDSADQVKATADEAATRTADHVRSAAADVQEPLKQ